MGVNTFFRLIGFSLLPTERLVRLVDGISLEQQARRRLCRAWAELDLLESLFPDDADASLPMASLRAQLRTGELMLDMSRVDDGPWIEMCLKVFDRVVRTIRSLTEVNASGALGRAAASDLRRAMVGHHEDLFDSLAWGGSADLARRLSFGCFR
ncbi:MAG: hypothetical protein HGB18_00175 [Candidatus Moranbacteria bacterium]|nr:hypothetical protein [Candidatus Moranbacteria bacterium]